VRLTSTSRAVDEKRVICLARVLYDGLRCGMGELVERSDDEVFESVSRIQVVVLVDIEILQGHGYGRRHNALFCAAAWPHHPS